MVQSFTRLGIGLVAALFFSVTDSRDARAVPSDVEAWSSLEQKITVYRDAVDREVYWFIPKIRFEANEGRTVLRPKTLASGKVEYTTRIIPYFSKDLRDLVTQNIPNIRQMSQLRPVVAKSIGISLPDFAYKFASPNVTNYQYLDVPRLIRFQLDPDEAETFDQLYQDELGVTVELTVAYEGVVTDKYYNVEVSCKQVRRELDQTAKAGVNARVSRVVLGADLQAAFVRSVENSANGVNIVSKGDVPGMQEMIRRVMNLCFDPVDDQGSSSGRYDQPYDPSAEEREADLEGERSDAEALMSRRQLRMKFRYKGKDSDTDNQVIVKNVAMKDSTSLAVIVDHLAAKAHGESVVRVEPIAEKAFRVGARSTVTAPFASGISVKNGEQYTIGAEFAFGVVADSSGKARSIEWDASWPKTAGDLYFRIGSGEWKPVNRRAIITSDITRDGGELQFYVDRSAILNKIPTNRRQGGVTLRNLAPVYVVEVSGRRIEVK